MPAVSVCEPIASAICHSLESGKSSENLSSSLASSAARILQSEIRYEEADGYRSTVLDQLKAKYIVLSAPNSKSPERNDSSLVKSSKKPKEMGPSLPEPAVNLYPAEKVHLGWKGNFPVGAGMYNVGNTCYLNSTLQALFHVPALVNWLLSDSHHTSKCEQNDGGGECLTCAVAKTLQFSHEKSGSAIKPFYIYNKLKLICRTMAPGQQEDAHEFLRYLLEGMERAYLARHRATKLESYSKETTPINRIFGGYLRTEVKCQVCRHVSTTFQHFQDLLVDIRKASSLDEALAAYFSREDLDNNDYKCEACKRRVPATKQFSLERAPKVLCVQLKRFSVLGGKISRHISFKQTVDMGPYLWREPGEPDRQLFYKLTSMVTHMGPSVNCGHYTAVAQVSTGQYYSFDDSCVRSVNLGNVLNTNAYIMIFEMESGQNNGACKITNGAIINKQITTNGVAKASTKNSSMSTSNAVESTNGTAKKSSPEEEITKSTNFIGPQLPPRQQEKAQQPRLVMHIKNGKVLNSSSLVPYDGSSEDEDTNLASGVAETSKNAANTSLTGGKIATTPGTNGFSRNTPAKESCKMSGGSGAKEAKNSMKTSSSLCAAKSPTTPVNSKTQNGASTGNGNISNNSSRHSNGKNETNGRNGESSNGKDKWHANRVKTGSDDRIVTKAATVSSVNRWQVSKDAPSPTSGSTTNGWSVTDKEGKPLSSSSANQAPSAAAPRNFNGTNRSETVSHLLKMSNRGYGTSSVANWNGGRAHLEREVDNERREERKRHFNSNDDDEEIDRGRTKKMKTRDYGTGRSNPGYNPFQEYSNGKTWNRGHSGGPYRPRHYYKGPNDRGNRPSHRGVNYRSHNRGGRHRYYNHSRDHWQRS